MSPQAFKLHPFDPKSRSVKTTTCKHPHKMEQIQRQKMEMNKC